MDSGSAREGNIVGLGTSREGNSGFRYFNGGQQCVFWYLKGA